MVRNGSLLIPVCCPPPQVIFISDVSKTGKTAPPFESLSVPLSSMISTSFQQPLLGSNFLAMSISPSPEGGLTDGTKAEVRCSGRLFEFAAALDKTRERAVEAMKNQDLELEDGLRESLSTYMKLAGCSRFPQRYTLPTVLLQRYQVHPQQQVADQTCRPHIHRPDIYPCTNVQILIEMYHDLKRSS
jgi:hypothetical protein